jgi:hypothetical protein
VDEVVRSSVEETLRNTVGRHPAKSGNRTVRIDYRLPDVTPTQLIRPISSAGTALVQSRIDFVVVARAMM